MTVFPPAGQVFALLATPGGLYSVVAPEGLPTYDRVYEGELLWCVETDVFLSSRGLLRRVYGHVVLRWEK